MRTKFPRTFISLHDRISSVRNFCIRPTPLSQTSLLSEIGSKKSNDLTKAKLKMRIVRVLKDNETIRVMYTMCQCRLCVAAKHAMVLNVQQKCTWTILHGVQWHNVGTESSYSSYLIVWRVINFLSFDANIHTLTKQLRV